MLKASAILVVLSASRDMKFQKFFVDGEDEYKLVVLGTSKDMEFQSFLQP